MVIMCSLFTKKYVTANCNYVQGQGESPRIIELYATRFYHLTMRFFARGLLYNAQLRQLNTGFFTENVLISFYYLIMRLFCIF